MLPSAAIPTSPTASSSSAQPATVHAALTTPKMAPAQFKELLAIMQADATQRMVNYFYGAELVYDAGLAGKVLGKMSQRLGHAATGVKGRAAIEGARAINLIRSTVTEIMDAVEKAMNSHAAEAGVQASIMTAVKSRATVLATSAFGSSFVASATPFIGILPDAYKAAKNSYAAIDGIVTAVHATRYSKVVKVGSPRAAADAVSVILQRKAAYLSTKATSSLINLGSGIANAASQGIATAADVGIKIATLIVDLIAELTMFAIEQYEFATGERLLEILGAWDHELLIQDDFAADVFPTAFNACPLLGSYMLASAPYFNTSDFVTLSAGPNELASVDEIERIAVDKVNPLRLYASQIIAESKLGLTHTRRSDIDKIMKEAAFRAQAQEAKSLKGRAKAAANEHLLEPLKRKWRALRA
jgi:3D (Asp-Asp-Asp) domain-containing protein